MTPDRAAKLLDTELRGRKWYVSTGVGARDGAPTLYVYVRSERHSELTKLRSGYLGFPIAVRKTGGIRSVKKRATASTQRPSPIGQ
jgi:hypothetical protein